MSPNTTPIAPTTIGNRACARKDATTRNATTALVRAVPAERPILSAVRYAAVAGPNQAVSAS